MTRIGDIFKSESNEAVWLMSLMCGRNDWHEVSRMVAEFPPASNPPSPAANGRLVYLLRLSLSHFYEHYDLLAKPPKASKRLMAEKMLAGMPEDRKLTHEEFWKQRVEPRATALDPAFQNRSLLEVLKDVRDVTFHYREESHAGADPTTSRIKSGLKIVEDDRVRIFEGDTLDDMRWTIADEVRMQYLKTKGFVMVGPPLDVHLDKLPAPEIGWLTDSLIWTYLSAFNPIEGSVANGA
jgi:hypothetical protein